jgi:hypothetical protein
VKVPVIDEVLLVEQADNALHSAGLDRLDPTDDAGAILERQHPASGPPKRTRAIGEPTRNFPLDEGSHGGELRILKRQSPVRPQPERAALRQVLGELRALIVRTGHGW